jgi:hypothetical protein
MDSQRFALIRLDDLGLSEVEVNTAMLQTRLGGAFGTTTRSLDQGLRLLEGDLLFIVVLGAELPRLVGVAVVSGETTLEGALPQFTWMCSPWWPSARRSPCQHRV